MNRRVTFFLFIVLFLPAIIFAQVGKTYSLKITSFPALTSLDFAGFIITDNLQGTPDVFSVTITVTPPGPGPDMVRIYGELWWKDVGASDYTRLVDFITKPFAARNFKNSDLGNVITLDKHHENTNLLQKNIDKGKPTGAYYMILQLRSPNSDVPLAADKSELSFENPSQTLSLMFPVQGMSLDPGNIVAIWTGVQGINGDANTYYYVRASERKYPGQPLEDALRSGNPFIDDQKITGNITSVNLRSLPFNREWTAGQEVVLQIAAHVGGIGGGNNLYSQPISFTIARPSDAAQMMLNNTIAAFLQGYISSIPPQVLASFFNGQIDVTGITSENGSNLTQADIQMIFAYLTAHPENIVKISFNKKN